VTAEARPGQVPPPERRTEEPRGESGEDDAVVAALRPVGRALYHINRVMLALGMVALVVASFILTYSVVSRYVFRAATDWQDEAAVFCIVGTVFLCGAFVQASRGHVGIEAVAGLLPAWMNRMRMIAVDLLSFLFCAFFAWKSWTLWHEAWVDKMTTSSTWAPPLAIPYGLMSFGMTLLALQLLLQLVSHFGTTRPR
jgi:TRAP-type C4-dicarboxylate transport system permease small subunit